METTKTTETPKNFRKEGTQWYLTYPKAGQEKTASEWLETLLTFLKDNKLEVSCAIVAKEKHKDGDPHLHMVFKLKETKRLRDCRFWDPIVGKHCNIGNCRNFTEKVLYTAKDGDFATHELDVEALRAAQKNKTAYGFESCAKDLNAGHTIEEVNDKSPGFVLQHAPKLEYYMSLKEGWSAEKEKPALPWNRCRAQNGSSFNNTRIANWLNNNLFKTLKERGDPIKQLWIKGESQIGKSTLASQLVSYARVYDMPMDGDWYDGFTGNYDLIVIEEFKGQKPVTWMNRFCDKFGMHLNQRKKKPYRYNGGIPVIVMSNLPPATKGEVKGCYTNITETETVALTRRFEYVDMDKEDLRIHFLEPEKVTLDLLTPSPQTPQPQPQPQPQTQTYEEDEPWSPEYDPNWDVPDSLLTESQKVKSKSLAEVYEDPLGTANRFKDRHRTTPQPTESTITEKEFLEHNAHVRGLATGDYSYTESGNVQYPGWQQRTRVQNFQILEQGGAKMPPMPKDFGKLPAIDKENIRRERKRQQEEIYKKFPHKRPKKN